MAREIVNLLAQVQDAGGAVPVSSFGRSNANALVSRRLADIWKYANGDFVELTDAGLEKWRIAMDALNNGDGV